MATPTDVQPQDDLRVGILGPLEVHRDGVACALGGRQQRFVLALLALETGHVVSLDRIADALWGDDLPPSYVTTIQTYVFRLREVLEPDRAKGDPARVLVSTPGGGYRLELPPAAVYALRFEADVVRGRAALEAGDASSAAAALGEALALWRGDVLSDLGDLGPGATAAQRLDEVRLVATEDWVAAELALGHHSALIPPLASLEAAHPLRERITALRMVSLYRSRRQAEALTVYREASQRLAEDLGVRPGEELRSLHERILKQDQDLGRSPAGDPPALLSWTSGGHGDSTSAESGAEARACRYRRPPWTHRWCIARGAPEPHLWAAVLDRAGRVVRADQHLVVLADAEALRIDVADTERVEVPPHLRHELATGLPVDPGTGHDLDLARLGRVGVCAGGHQPWAKEHARGQQAQQDASNDSHVYPSS
jgi:DNA-binding SARP family transcriptional activator